MFPSITILRHLQHQTLKNMKWKFLYTKKNFTGTLSSCHAMKDSKFCLPKMKLLLSVQRRSMGNHGFIWTIERLVYLLLAGSIPYGIMFPSKQTDNLMAILSTAHLHWGMEAIAIDYVRKVIFGPVIPKIFMGFLFLLSCTTLGLLIDYNVNSIGIGKSIRRTWEIKGC